MGYMQKPYCELEDGQPVGKVQNRKVHFLENVVIAVRRILTMTMIAFYGLYVSLTQVAPGTA